MGLLVHATVDGVALGQFLFPLRNHVMTALLGAAMASAVPSVSFIVFAAIMLHKGTLLVYLGRALLFVLNSYMQWQMICNTMSIESHTTNVLSACVVWPDDISSSARRHAAGSQERAACIRTCRPGMRLRRLCICIALTYHSGWRHCDLLRDGRRQIRVQRDGHCLCHAILRY